MTIKSNSQKVIWTMLSLNIKKIYLLFKNYPNKYGATFKALNQKWKMTEGTVLSRKYPPANHRLPFEEIRQKTADPKYIPSSETQILHILGLTLMPRAKQRWADPLDFAQRGRREAPKLYTAAE